MSDADIAARAAESDSLPAASRREQPVKPRAGRVLLAFQKYGLVFVFAVVFAFFALDPRTGATFRSSVDLDSVLADQSVAGLVALAMVLPLTGHYFDLSVAANVGVVNITMAALIAKYGWPIWLGLTAGLLVGVLIGAITGFIVAVLRLNAFIATFGMYVLLLGVSEWYTGDGQIANLPLSLGNWGSAKWLGVPRPFWVLLLVALILWFVLSHTPYGRYLESIGSNEKAAKLVGINTNRTILLSFVGAGAIAGIAGDLLTAQLGGADATDGSSYLFPAFAVVFLGATVIRPGRYNVWGTVIAACFVGFAVSGIILLGASTYASDVFDGAALIVAVALYTFSGRAHERRASRKAHLGHE
jgi:ribose transport system permease protein